jgi:hypothetical protein
LAFERQLHVVGDEDEVHARVACAAASDVEDVRQLGRGHFHDAQACLLACKRRESDKNIRSRPSKCKAVIIIIIIIKSPNQAIASMQG